MKSARSEKSDSSGNLNVMMDLNNGRSFVWFRKVEEIPGIYVRRHLQASRWVTKTSPIFSRTRTEISI